MLEAILIGAVGSWQDNTCPIIDVPPEVAHLVRRYQNAHVIYASSLKAAGWIWNGGSLRKFLKDSSS